MVVLALLWGSAFLWVDLALAGGMTPPLIATLRSALGAVVLLLLAGLARQRLPRDLATWGRVTVAALWCNAVPFLLIAVGQRTVDSGTAGVVNATTPLWSLLLGLVLGMERRPHPLRLTGLLVGFAGTVVLLAPWRQPVDIGLGAIALLGAAISYAVAFTYMARHLTGTGSGPLALSAAQLLAATGLSIPLLLVDGLPASPPSVTATGWAAVVALGVLSTGLTFYLNFRLIGDVGATTTASVGYLLPVVSVSLGAVVLSEVVDVRVVLGMVVVLVGVALTRRHAPPRAESAPRQATPSAGTAPGAPPSRPGGGVEPGR
ncbi:DMT family transporter [Actinoalloteichus caeruleus]|uniref:DMT family transporter n=1 Tax=Actinoalloteichus cyanogriseus TaxID=2893586 RepID=UPI0009E061BC|nr:DMT family transporter [Actinoalloteichus caeruleus]